MNEPRTYLSQQGIGKLTLLVFGTLIAALVYSAYYILPFYYYYFEINSQFQQVIQVASTENDQEIRRRLMYHIKKMELPVEPEDLKIERTDNYMRISMPYREVFFVTWQDKEYEIYTFDFNAYAEGPFAGRPPRREHRSR